MTTQATASDLNAFVGIDFGTTKTMVASYDPGKKSAKPLTFGRGKFEKPTSMYATETGDLLFGDDADDEGITDVLNHIRRFKLKLGNPDWKHVGRKSGTAAQLTTEFLASLRSQMNNQVLHTSVDRVVLTVPAMFGPAQKHDLTEAARQAGFSQVELLEEPVAAGIAYCDHQSDLSKQLCFIVVDWGGGTFDVAHLEKFSSGDIKVYEDFVVGLDDIGGEVFDDELWSIALNALSSAGHGTLNYENLGRYRRDLSRAKETLSSQASVSMTFALTDGEPARITLNRADFNDIISPLIQKAASFVSQLIVRAQNAGCPPEFILLAGGTSRIPLIAQELERITGVKCRQWSDGREAIALGAAIRAHQLWGHKDAQNTQVERAAADEKQAATAQYKNLLEGAWIDGVISYEERIFLGKKRKELGLTIEESEAIQIQILGDLISHISKPENDTASPTKSNSSGSPNAVTTSSRPGYSERKFNCPNPQCGKEMILTPDEFARKIYTCPYCAASGSISHQPSSHMPQIAPNALRHSKEISEHTPEQWHYAQDGTANGPIDRITLKSMLQDGKLSPNSLVWREGMAEWKPARKVSELDTSYGTKGNGTIKSIIDHDETSAEYTRKPPPIGVQFSSFGCAISSPTQSSWISSLLDENEIIIDWSSWALYQPIVDIEINEFKVKQGFLLTNKRIICVSDPPLTAGSRLELSGFEYINLRDVKKNVTLGNYSPNIGLLPYLGIAGAATLAIGVGVILIIIAIYMGFFQKRKCIYINNTPYDINKLTEMRSIQLINHIHNACDQAG